MDYNYLKDNRSQDTYKQNVNAGFINQGVVIEHLIEEYKNAGWQLIVKITDNNKEFQDSINTIEKYSPDIEMIFGKDGYFKYSFPCEIKVSDKENGSEIHIKKYQIDKLAEIPNSCLLYSTPTKYFILLVEDIRMCPVKNSDLIGGKECYIISGNLKWKHWSKPLTINEYQKDEN